MSAARAGLPKARLEAVVDGITAFVLTVLVFDIVVPAAGHSKEELPALLRAQGPPFVTFLITAAVIATFWLGHAQQMNFVTRVDRTLVWINFGGLACVVLLPFTTSYLGRYLGQPLATSVYGLNVGLVGVAGLAQWRWAAARGKHLMRSDTPDDAVRDLTRRIVLALALTAVGVAISWWSGWAAMGFYALAFLPFATRGLHEDHLKHE
jgi:uncharacterized membrane protein